MQAKIYRAEDLKVGLKVTCEREITEGDVISFARLSGDQNPLHVDAGYAKQSNYQGRIVHGAFQLSLASALLGMRLPGQNALLTSINCRFPSPLYYPTRVVVAGEIISWNLHTLGGQLRVIITEAETAKPAAEISMGFSLHERRAGRETASTLRPHTRQATRLGSDQRKLVVVTGASGGIGSAIASALAADCDILALVNKRPLPEHLRLLPNVIEQQVDLTQPDMEEVLLSQIGSRDIYGLIHAAWPSAPRGSLLHADQETIKCQLNFGAMLTVRLARFLYEHAPADGGRFIALSSTAGSFKPYLPLSVYSLGKACLENVIRLLAPEMARKKITINATCPSFVPVGINKQADGRKLLQESAAIPMGRLCRPEDIVGIVSYLMSPDASFVSGQAFALTGAQL